jgi:alkane 1-monooxygenase
MPALQYTVIFLLPLAVITGYLLGGGWNFLAPLLVFLLIPALDLVIGTSTKNPSPAEEEALSESRPHAVITWICAPLQVLLVAWGAWTVSRGTLSALEITGFTLSMGISSGAMGINVSHELSHRVKSRLEILLSRAMLSTVLYMHWAIGHVAGHHAMVATPHDPATARFGEPFWSFLPRTVSMGFVSSWNLEARRLARQGKLPWHPANRIIRYVAVEAALVLGVMIWLGPLATAFFLFQALVAIWLLETVNYVEHYGMRRKELGGGKYEPVRPVHSWNSSNILTNLFLFNLQRHSDHHYKPGRRYQILRHFEESPQLPTGYAGMILLAVVPPLWRAVMDDKAREHLLRNGYEVP